MSFVKEAHLRFVSLFRQDKCVYMGRIGRAGRVLPGRGRRCRFLRDIQLSIPSKVMTERRDKATKYSQRQRQDTCKRQRVVSHVRYISVGNSNGAFL